MGILENTKFILSVCELYYIKGLSQKEISAELNISRAQISRIITMAKEQDMVSIHLNYPNSEENLYENAIKGEYGINQVYVYDLGDAEDDKNSNRILAEKSSDLFSILIKDGEKVGVMSGRTVSCLANAIPTSKNRRLQFIPLCGGQESAGSDWFANTIAQRFAQKTNGKYYVFNAPQYLMNVETKSMLLNEPNIKEVVELGRHCDSTLIGIGSVDYGSTGSRAGNLKKEDLDALQKMGAKANICSSYVDENGKILDTPFSSRILGASMSDIRNSKKIGVARGTEKVPAIRAVLKGRLLDVLVTSLDTAKKIIGKE